jgi:hypothetical protein
MWVFSVFKLPITPDNAWKNCPRAPLLYTAPLIVGYRPRATSFTLANILARPVIDRTAFQGSSWIWK